MRLHPRVLAAARALAGLSQGELAREAGVHRNIVLRIEAGADLRVSTQEALIAALANHGVEFVQGGPEHVGGVMLRLPPSP